MRNFYHTWLSMLCMSARNSTKVTSLSELNPATKFCSVSCSGESINDAPSHNTSHHQIFFQIFDKKWALCFHYFLLISIELHQEMDHWLHPSWVDGWWIFNCVPHFSHAGMRCAVATITLAFKFHQPLCFVTSTCSFTTLLPSANGSLAWSWLEH